MDEKNNMTVYVRRLQEEQENIIKAGYLREMAKWHRAQYDAYICAGFTPEQALELVKVNINSKKPL